MLTLTSCCLTARILPLGASLAGLWHKDVPHSLVLGSPDETAYESDLMYFGSIVGPIANRIAGAQLSIGVKTYRMEANDGKNCLHSGSNGTHALTWDVEEQREDSITLRVALPDGAAGLPGNRVITACYRVTDDAELHLTLTATSDADTVMNPAHHPYWSLDGCDTVGGHELHINADEYLPVNDQVLPIGTVTPVDDTRHDFRRLAAVPIDMILDENFCLADARHTSPVHAATLIGSNGVKLDVETTEPGLQVYNGSGFTGSDCILLDDRRLIPFAGVALEPQGWPDAPNQPHFPSIALKASATYRQHTIYRLSTQLS